MTDSELGEIFSVNEAPRRKRRARFTDAEPLLHTYEPLTPQGSLVYDNATPSSSTTDDAELPSFLTNDDDESALFVTPDEEFRALFFAFVLAGAVASLPTATLLVASPFWLRTFGANDIGRLIWCSLAFLMARLAFVPSVGLLFADLGSILVRLPLGVAGTIVTLVTLLFTEDLVVALVASVLLGFSDALVGGSLFVAPQFHPRFVSATAIGSGCAGLIVSAAQVCIYGFIPPYIGGDERQRLMARTLVAAVSTLAVFGSVGFRIALRRAPTSLHYLKQTRAERVEFLTSRTPLRPSLRRASASIARQMFSIVFNALDTALFMALAAVIAPRQYSLPLIPFFAALASVFHLFDTIGKCLPRFDRCVLVAPRWIVVPVLGRMVVFVPLVVMCIHPHLIFNDIATFAIVAMLGLTSGYFGTLAFIFAPPLASTDDREMAHALMLTMHALGNVLGVVIAKLLIQFVPGFSPDELVPVPID